MKAIAVRPGAPRRVRRGAPGHDYLITGHENFGRIVEVGPSVPSVIRPGGLVVATVRRPGMSAYDRIGLQGTSQAKASSSPRRRASTKRGPSS